jgi:hypothetical protein
LKRRPVDAAQAAIDGVEWALWLELDDRPVPIVAFREPLEPNSATVNSVFALLKGWLIDHWSAAEAKAVVQTHPRARRIEPPVSPNGADAAIGEVPEAKSLS